MLTSHFSYIGNVDMLCDEPGTVKPNEAWYDMVDVMALVQCVNLLPLLYMMPYLSAQWLLQN